VSGEPGGSADGYLAGLLLAQRTQVDGGPTAFAEKLSALCSSGPTFRNLDLVRVDEL